MKKLILYFLGIYLILILISFNVYQMFHFILEKKQKRNFDVDDENKLGFQNLNEKLFNDTS
jgi:hypothetical protein